MVIPTTLLHIVTIFLIEVMGQLDHVTSVITIQYVRLFEK